MPSLLDALNEISPDTMAKVVDGGVVRALHLLLQKLGPEATLGDLRELVAALVVEKALLGDADKPLIYLNGGLMQEVQDELAEDLGMPRRKEGRWDRIPDEI